MLSVFQTKYHAYELTRRYSSDNPEKFTRTLADAQVALQPHQIEAALFTFRSPFSKGAILADEVGLGKTVEAGILISQKWSENKRRILVICPSNLRKQWNQELIDKFFLSSVIMEAKNFNTFINKEGIFNPFDQEGIFICSYHFASSKSKYLEKARWDLVVIDEAHRLRNVYKKSSKIANSIKDALASTPKVLLTATPLQNSLLELYGLVSIIDEHVFGDETSFRTQFCYLQDAANPNFTDLQNRLKPVCHRTLRRDVQEYVNYTNRHSIVQEFIPSQDEQKLYELVSDYLREPKLFALPSSQRQLMTLILRKLLSSSTYAIGGTLEILCERLQGLNQQQEALSNSLEEKIAEDYEALDEIRDEWIDDEDAENGEDEKKSKEKQRLNPEDRQLLEAEYKKLKEFSELAHSIKKNSKGERLLEAIQKGFERLEETGGNKKALVFTESTRTQKYLYDILQTTDYGSKIVLFNGSNNDDKSKQIYDAWLAKHKGTDRITGSKTADKRQALVDYFHHEGMIMIATEAGAEGINLQFCSLIVNYDMPWNPQRIEQRIGRCHRYGQKNDVIVVNFLNKANAADQRVYQLLKEKFKLFDGVFGASDEVLGTVISGVDFEKAVVEICQKCRIQADIHRAFDELQLRLEPQIEATLSNAKQKLLDNFSVDVVEKLKLTKQASNESLSRHQQMLWDLTKAYLQDKAEFDDKKFYFYLKDNPFPKENIHFGPYRLLAGEEIEEENIYRPGHSLAEKIIQSCKNKILPLCEAQFTYTGKPSIPILKALQGQSGWMSLYHLTIQSAGIEDYFLFCGIADNGEILEQEQCRRMLSLPTVQGKEVSCPESVVIQLGERLEGLKKQSIVDLESRNRGYFGEEMDKLDKWADDQKKAIQFRLEEIDSQIKELKKQLKLAASLPDELELRRKKKEMDKRRDVEWENYQTYKKLIENQQDGMIDKVEKALGVIAQENVLFNLRWTLN